MGEGGGVGSQNLLVLIISSAINTMTNFEMME